MSQTPDDPPKPRPLDYASPEPAKLGGAILAACLTVLLVIFSVFLGFAFTQDTRNTARGIVVPYPYAVWLVELALLLALSLYLYRAPARRRFALGIWIGLGVALLLEGICFGVLR